MLEKNGFSFQNGGLNNKVHVFHDNVRRHLSAEYLQLSSRMDDLENELMQLRVEKEQKDKQLFQTIDKRDSRRYFTPLNVVDIVQEEKDEKQKQLSMDMERIETSMQQISARQSEIKNLLSDIDDILADVKSMKEQDEIPEENSIHVPRLSMEDVEAGSVVYPQLLRNLYNLVDEYSKKQDGPELLLEFTDNNQEMDLSLNHYILDQLRSQIDAAVKYFSANMILIQGSLTAKELALTLSYTDDTHKMDSMTMQWKLVR